MIEAAERSRVTATPAARKAIDALRAAHGHGLMFVQSGGCCAGSVPMCFPEGELIVGDGDILMGDIHGCPFYIDARLHAAWRCERLVLDIEPGPPEGFSLGAGPGAHFVTRPIGSEDSRSAEKAV